MRMRTRLAALSALCLLSSCATAYQPDGITGGYSDQRLSDSSVRVSFRGNRFTSPETLDSYLLRRCADITMQNGYGYFVMTAPIEEGAEVNGAKVDDQFSASTTIQMFKGKQLGSVANVYDAAAVIRSTPVDEGETAEATPPPVAIANANTVSSAARILIVNPNALTNEPPPFEKF
jgi:hypothetical protein